MRNPLLLLMFFGLCPFHSAFGDSVDQSPPLTTNANASKSADASDQNGVDIPGYDPDASMLTAGRVALLRSEANRRIKDRNYKDAIPILQKVAELDSKESGDVALYLSDLLQLSSADFQVRDLLGAEKNSSLVKSLILKQNHIDSKEYALISDVLGYMEYSLGHMKDAEADESQALKFYGNNEKYKHDQLEPLVTLANIHINLGLYDKAETEVYRARSLVEPGDGVLASEIFIELANIYAYEGKTTQAETILRQELNKTDDVNYKYKLLSALIGIYYLNNEVVEAGNAISMKLKIAKDSQLSARYEDVLEDQAIMEQRLYHLPQAQEFYLQALKIAETNFGNNSLSLFAPLNNLGVIYQKEGKVTDAIRIFRRSANLAERSSADLPLAAALTNLAGAYSENGEYIEALETARKATSILATDSFSVQRTRLRTLAREQEDNVMSYNRHLDILSTIIDRDPNFDPGLVGEAFIVAQLDTNPTVGATFLQAQARFAAKNDKLADLIRQREDAVAAWQNYDDKIVQEMKGISKGGSAIDDSATIRERNVAEAKIESLNTIIATGFPLYQDFLNPRPIRISDVQSLLAPDECMLVYHNTLGRMLLWAIRKDGTDFYRLSSSESDLQALVSNVRSGLDLSESTDLPPFDITSAVKLYKIAVAPAERRLQGAKVVFIVPDGALQSIPFSILVVQPDRSSSASIDYRKVKWFAREHATTILPTVTAFRGLRNMSSNIRAGRPFIGIGDPLLGRPKLRQGYRGIDPQTIYRGTQSRLEAIRDLPSLPETEKELKEMGAAFGADSSDLYLKERATKPIVSNLPLKDYRIVAFATHALVAGNFSGSEEPALILTPPERPDDSDNGLLTASNITQLKLNADWVILSACNTASISGDGASGLSGLAQSFFYAGSRALLVSYWPVASVAAAKLTIGMANEIKRDPLLGRAQALQTSEMNLLDDRSLDQKFAHPAIWAPFSLVGDAGPLRAH